MKNIILILVLFSLLAPSAQAAFNLSGTNLSLKFCEVIKITSSPYYSLANGGFSGGSLFTNANGDSVTFNASTGAVDFTFGENAETPLSAGGTQGNATLIVRGWAGDSAGSGDYCYSQQFNLGTSMQGVQPIALTFSGWYKQGSPTTPTVTAKQTGFSNDLKPLLAVTFAPSSVADYELVQLPAAGKFHYTVTEYDQVAKVKVGAALLDSNTNTYGFSTSQNDPIAPNKAYLVEVYAVNGFSSFNPSNVNVGTALIDTAGVSAMGVAQSFTLPLHPGINFIALPFAAGETGSWYESDGTEIKNAYTLIQAINKAAGNKQVVSTFGKWDSVNKKDAGVHLIFNNLGNAYLGSQPVSLADIAIKQGEGYQIYIGNVNGASEAPPDPINLVIKNQATVVTQ